MDYTNIEMADIHYFYGLGDGNSLRARELYLEQFPNRRAPHRNTFDAINRRLREIGQFTPLRVDAGRERIMTYPNLAEAVLEYVADNPSISTRRLAAEFHTSQSSIWRILHEAGLYPYHLQRVQALQPKDYQPRFNFCQWFLHQPRIRNRNFGAFVLFTDEAEFTRDGINNFHNQHLWETENPHGIVESKHQQRFSWNVWGGIVDENLLGPVFL